MLKTAERSIRKSPNQVMMVQKEGKKRRRKKSKTTYSISSTKSKPTRKFRSGPANSDVCHNCSKPGHWTRNCKVYLEEQKNKKGSGTPASGDINEKCVQKLHSDGLLESFDFKSYDTWAPGSTLRQPPAAKEAVVAASGEASPLSASSRSGRLSAGGSSWSRARICSDLGGCGGW
ncbi:hypothetical protein GUJ93_ZPchr0010g11063 [Zizania palustris]|uniref:CCHC-type domain-containing protein n=1 Tax=Zizania palustris TaxID=103762 RepID=A0A8J5WHG3_ZIZPA|nr:hypothetical protein GUJ93_ZPchr0010g11063 [Zizania palustris]